VKKSVKKLKKSVKKSVKKLKKSVKKIVKKLKKSVKKSVKRSKYSDPDEKCVYQTSKKYQSRPSPPYPANLCRGMTKFGNDPTRLYTSSPDSKGVYRWVQIDK
jgi:DNA repair ATPase RecN